MVVAVHLFLVKDGEILLMRRFNTGWSDGFYSVPAGHLDRGEEATNAVIREAKEETGLEIERSLLKVVHTMHRRAEEERIDLFFSASNWTGVPRIIETHRCDDMRWFPVYGLPHNMVPYVEAAVRCFQQSATYSEFGWK
jgi:ADP-ribose pyrophosphatase YjhB (NUDIX family)